MSTFNTVISRPCTVIFSFTDGSFSELLKYKPPTVATSDSCDSKPKNSSKSSISVFPSTTHCPGPSLLIPLNLSSCSSGKSPTNSERTSFIVITPSIPPFSSITHAKLAWFSLSIFSAERTVVYSGRYIASFTKFSTSTEVASLSKLNKYFTYTMTNV